MGSAAELPLLNAPTPPSLSPLDAESQERLKAERKRLRNRIAASKCRRRKLERIARLEEKVKALKGQNAELAATANLLRAQVTQLQGRPPCILSEPPGPGELGECVCGSRVRCLLSEVLEVCGDFGRLR
uniref:Transcription factor JunB n=1 Tax=Anas zonorhyncha TaxID=75864 RepID=A0A8C0A1N1_9AVES